MFMSERVVGGWSGWSSVSEGFVVPVGGRTCSRALFLFNIPLLTWARSFPEFCAGLMMPKFPNVKVSRKTKSWRAPMIRWSVQPALRAGDRPVLRRSGPSDRPHRTDPAGDPVRAPLRDSAISCAVLLPLFGMLYEAGVWGHLGRRRNIEVEVQDLITFLLNSSIRLGLQVGHHGGEELVPDHNVSNEDMRLFTAHNASRDKRRH
jgi:hypothetical protein